MSGVALQVVHEGGRDRLPAHGLALLAQEDQALVRVQILRAHGEGTAAAACGLGVQAQQQRVQGGVVARGGGDMVDLSELGIGDRATGGGQPPWFVDLARGVSSRVDQFVVLGVAVEAAQGGDEVLGRRAATTRVAARDNMTLSVILLVSRSAAGGPPGCQPRDHLLVQEVLEGGRWPGRDCFAGWW